MIVERDGTVLGEHDGIDRFTIGQRKAGRRRGAGCFVLEILPESRTVVVGDPEDLLAAGLVASQVNWLADAPEGSLRCAAKIRYRHAGVPATVTATSDGGAMVRFDEPQPAVTPGQAVAFYDGSRVLGGGWIERAARRKPAEPKGARNTIEADHLKSSASPFASLWSVSAAALRNKLRASASVLVRGGRG